MDLFLRIKNHVVANLRKGLSPDLTYHNLAHTLDVLEQAVIIAKHEKVTNPADILILQTSALYHDVGFTQAYGGHEERGCLIAAQELTQFNFTPAQIERVCGMIRATKIPQTPQTALEAIICDADLDYLGRADFFEIGDGLFRELLHHRIIQNDREWDLLQINFLEKHHYFTHSSIQRRQKNKLQHLKAIKERSGMFN